MQASFATRCVARVDGGFPPILLKNSNFSVDHNSEGRRRA